MPSDPLAWETIESDTVYECDGFAVRQDTVTLPSGQETEFDYVHEPPGVIILPFTPDGDVIAIEEWRQAVGRINRGLPAGSSEPDDPDIESTARRELLEETGHQAGEIEPLCVFEPANGPTDFVNHYFVATDCEPAGDQSLDLDESIRVTRVPYEELLTAATEGDLRDGRSALGILYYELGT